MRGSAMKRKMLGDAGEGPLKYQLILDSKI